MKRILGYLLFLLFVGSLLFGIAYLLERDWTASIMPLAMAAIYLYLSAKLLQSQKSATPSEAHTEHQAAEQDGKESKEQNDLDINAFEIAERLIEAFEPQLASARTGTKLKYFDAISGYLYGLTYGYLKAEDKLSQDNHFSLTENIHLGVFGDIEDVAKMLREHFVKNSYYRTDFGKSVFNYAADDGFKFAKSGGNTALRLNQVLLAAKQHESSGVEEALHSLGKGTRAAIEYTKENIISPISHLSGEFKRCTYCDEKVKLRAKKCKHCGEWLSETEPPKKPKKKAAKKSSGITKTSGTKPKAVKRKVDSAPSAEMVTSEILLIMKEISPSNTAAKIKVRTNDFAVGYLLGYVDGYMQRNKLFETDDIERAAFCTIVLSSIFGTEEGPYMFRIAAEQQLDNKDLHLGMQIGGEEGFRHIAPEETSLAKEFLRPQS